jgi:murein peptide amidase A
MKRTLFALLLLSGCASHFPEAGTRMAAPETQRPQTSASAPQSRAAPQVIGSSVQGRPIEMYSFGAVENGRPVLVMGAIHGNETGSAEVSRGLLAELIKSPRAASDGVNGVPVVIIPIANPDGFVAGTRQNANKVDVNRNFPARNWTARPTSRRSQGGKQAASEPETVALMTTIERLRPRLIITVHSIEHEKHCNNYDGPAREIAEIMSKHNGYPAVPTIGYPTPGSLGNWGGNDRQIPMITLELPRALPAARAWPDNRAAVYAAIAAVDEKN